MDFKFSCIIWAVPKALNVIVAYLQRVKTRCYNILVEPMALKTPDTHTIHRSIHFFERQGLVRGTEKS